MFTGTYTAIVTPFKNGKIDEAALERLIQAPGPRRRGRHRAGRHHGRIADGGLRRAHPHHRAVGEVRRGRIKVLAGTGGNSTSEAIYLTERAEKAGADGSLQVAPYYNKPTQEGLFQHFREVRAHTRLPIVLYSIPGPLRHRDRRGHRQAPGAANARTSSASRKPGGNADRVSQLRAALGPRFEILSGDDSLTLPFMAVGAQGVISVASNVIPRQVAQMVEAFAAGKTQPRSSCTRSITRCSRTCSSRPTRCR